MNFPKFTSEINNLISCYTDRRRRGKKATIKKSKVLVVATVEQLIKKSNAINCPNKISNNNNDQLPRSVQRV